MIYYIYHSGFVLELEKSILIFDFYRIPTDKKNEEESFISKFIKRTDKKVYVFSSHSHSDHFNKEILKWLNLNENIKYILSDDIKIHKHKNFYFTKEGDSFELDNLKISTFGSTDLGSSFYVNVEDKNIFHSGDLHLFVPVGTRLGVNTLEGVELFYKVLKPKLIVPMHFSDDYSQMKNFIENFKNIKDVEVIEIDESMKKILE